MLRRLAIGLLAVGLLVIAAPAFAQIAKFDLQYLNGGVPPDAPATASYP